MRINNNSVVIINYSVFDLKTKELLEKEEFSYIQGFNQFPNKIEEELMGKTIGDKIVVDLYDEYGEFDENLIYPVHRDDISDQDDDAEIKLGDEFEIDLQDDETGDFETRIAKVIEINGDNIVIDANHPFAGRDVKFEVEVLDVREATDKELQTGEVYFND